jgi:hypothetical protein
VSRKSQNDKEFKRWLIHGNGPQEINGNIPSIHPIQGYMRNMSLQRWTERLSLYYICSYASIFG